MLNSIIAELRGHGCMGVGLICQGGRLMSVLVFFTFFFVLFTGLTYASVLPLLWWLFDDDTLGLCSAFGRMP